MIEPAKPEDLDQLVAMGRVMHQESPRWSRLTFSEVRVRATIAELLDSPDGLVLIARREGSAVGAFLGLMSLDWMSDQRTAQELALFVLPECRGSMIACRMICAFVAWAKMRGAVWLEAGVSTGVAVERTAALYQRLGFEPCMIGLEKRNV